MTTLLVPGLDGSPAPHWQAWWADRDPGSVVVLQDDFAAPDPTGWELRLAMALHATPGALVVAHSLGAIVAVRAATRWPQLEIGGALLVAPADVERPLDARIAAFGPIPRRRLPFPAVVAASRNDPWMSLARARRFAGAWGATLVDLGDAGHVNVESGHGPWPEGVALAEGLRAPRSLARVAI
jgi:predicted alpha/beta hydrolase family esterase